MNILYTCPYCRNHYDTPNEAEECMNQPLEDGGFKVGDIVLIPSQRHGWCCNPEWIAYTTPADKESNSHFNHIDNHNAWYVITAIVRGGYNNHQFEFHVATMAYSSGDKPQVGYTKLWGHYQMYLPSNIGEANTVWRIPEGLELTPPPNIVTQCADFAKLGLTGDLL